MLGGEVGEVLFQRVYSGGAEEEHHVVVHGFVGGEVVGDGAIHYGFGVCYLEAVHVVCALFVDVRDGEEEFFLMVFVDCGLELRVVEFAVFAEEDFAFAVYDVFLQVEGDGLGGAEIFHCVGDVDACFFGEAEEVVDGGTGCENNGCKVGDVYFCLTEFFGCEAFYFDHGTEHEFHSVALCDVKVRRFFG